MHCSPICANPFFGFAFGPIENVNIMACVGEVSRHGVTHIAESNKRAVCHMLLSHNFFPIPSPIHT